MWTIHGSHGIGKHPTKTIALFIPGKHNNLTVTRQDLPPQALCLLPRGHQPTTTIRPGQRAPWKHARIAVATTTNLWSLEKPGKNDPFCWNEIWLKGYVSCWGCMQIQEHIIIHNWLTYRLYRERERVSVHTGCSLGRNNQHLKQILKHPKDQKISSSGQMHYYSCNMLKSCSFRDRIPVAVFSFPHISWIPHSPHLCPSIFTRLSNKSTRRFWKRLLFVGGFGHVRAE